MAPGIGHLAERRLESEFRPGLAWGSAAPGASDKSSSPTLPAAARSPGDKCRRAMLVDTTSSTAARELSDAHADVTPPRFPSSPAIAMLHAPTGRLHMASTKMPTRSNTRVVARPNTAAGHSAMARDHARMAAHHASKAEALSHDKMRETPRSQRTAKPRVGGGFSRV